MQPALLVAVVVVLVFAGASFFFALAETALFSLSKWQARQLVERDPVTGGVVDRLLAEAQDLLATMVLGNTLASAAMLATALWMALNGHCTLAEAEKETILQIVRLDRRTAKEVMRPRSQMAAIPDDLSIEEMIEAARRYKHRRLPMYDQTPDTIVGILNTRALLLDPQIDLT